MELPIKIIRYDPVKREVLSDDPPIKTPRCPFWEISYVYAPYIPESFISKSLDINGQL